MTQERSAAASRADGSSEDRRRTEPVTLALLAAPGLAMELAQQLARELPGILARRFPGIRWDIVVRAEPMAAASDNDVDLVEIAHRRMLAEGWKLAICLTDFPIHVGNRPVTAHASATYGVGLVSVPALGAINLDDRVLDAVLRLIEGLLGESVSHPDGAEDRERHARMRERLVELASPVGHAQVQEDRTFRFVTAVGRGNFRLLLGMVRANRPWRLIAGLSRAIVGALGLDIFGVASPGIWILSAGLGWGRIALFAVASIVVIAASLITAHGLWERSYSDRPEVRERVALFNMTTALTIAIGVLTLFLALFVINLLSGLLLITTGVFHKEAGTPVDFGAYLKLAVVVTALATLGGALGAALENDRVVRQAAYGYRADARTEAQDSAAPSGAA
jgi:hypothetical protein